MVRTISGFAIEDNPALVRCAGFVWNECWAILADAMVGGGVAVQFYPAKPRRRKASHAPAPAVRHRELEPA